MRATVLHRLRSEAAAAVLGAPPPELGTALEAYHAAWLRLAAPVMDACCSCPAGQPCLLYTSPSPRD
eukprot:14293873-Alexandrium_andersonii.AAC.1